MRLVPYRLMRLYYWLLQRVEPKNPLSHIVRAERAADEGAWGECYDQSDAALRQDGTLSWGYFLRALARLNLDDYSGALRDIGLFLAHVEEPPPVVYYWRGWLYCQRGEWSLAQADFDRALPMTERRLDLFYWRAYAQWQRGAWDEMRATLDHLDALQAGHPLVAELWGHLHLHEEALDKAEASYSYALSGGLDSASLRYNRAVTRRLRGRLDEAREDVEALLATEPDNGLAHLEVSHLDFQEGALERALLHAQRATQLLGTTHLEARSHEIAILSEQGDYERALELADELARHYPSSPILSELLAQLYLLAGRHEQALRMYRDTVATLPGDCDAQFRLAEALMETGHFSEAEPLLDALLVARPDDPELHAARADLYRHTDRPHEMAAELEWLLARDPTNPWALTYRASYRHWCNDLAGAEADYRAALADDEAAGWMWAFGGDFYLRRGNWQRALTCFQEGIIREPENAWIRRRWADWLWATGDHATAITVLECLVEDEPQDGHASMALAERWLQLGHFPHAERRLHQLTEEGHELAWLAHAALAALRDGAQRMAHHTQATLLRPEATFWGTTPARLHAQQALLACLAGDPAAAATHLDAARQACEFGEELWPALSPLLAHLGATALLEQVHA